MSIHRFSTVLSLYVGTEDPDHLALEEAEAVVTYEWTPGQEGRINCPIDKAEPSFPENIQIIGIKLPGFDSRLSALVDLAMHDDELLIDQCWEHFEGTYIQSPEDAAEAM